MIHMQIASICQRIYCCGPLLAVLAWASAGCDRKDDKDPTSATQGELSEKDASVATPATDSSTENLAQTADGGIEAVATPRVWDGGPGTASCSACRNAHCRSYEGVDLVAGCFEKVNPTFGAPKDDGKFTQECSNIIACAAEAKCAYEDPKRASGCYCGSAPIDDCASKGPAKDAPCAPEWFAGVRAKTNKEVHERFTDLVYPAGWAYALLDCDREFCLSECSPDDKRPGKPNGKRGKEHSGHR